MRKGLDRLVNALAVIAGALLCGLVVLICFDVVARSSRVFSLPWALDVAEWALFLITFLGAPWVLREHGHIAIEIFVARLPGAAQRAVGWLANLIGALVCAVLLVYAVRQLLRSFDSGNMIYETFVYAEWYQYAVPPPIFALLLILFVLRLVRPQAAPPQALDEGF
ncbi:MAG: TRAP transporter small permease subunit [Burkholderiaceae bacterium]